MMVFKKAIPRRTFLRGVGTSIALPFLDSMVPAFGAVKPVVRLAIVYLPVGRLMRSWKPKTEGSGFDMTPTLEPLSPFRDQLLVLSGLNIKAADSWENEPGGGHARPAGAFLTGIHPKPGGAVGISMDQVAARHLGKETQLASIELGLDSGEVTSDDGAYSAYYLNTISWRSGTTPLPTEINPRVVFERLFGDADSTDPVEQLRRVKTQHSVLDSVTDRVSRLMREVGPSDQKKLTEYFDSVRDIERRVEVAEKASIDPPTEHARQHVTMPRPLGIPNTFAEHARLMFDLQVAAFQSDLTRVITFMLGVEQTNRSYPEIGISDGHHAVSHHGGNPLMMSRVEQIDLYQSKQLAYFVEKMRSARDGDGSLLDHSIIFAGSCLSEGQTHSHDDVPVLLIGGGAGQLKGGRHMAYGGLPLSNLHLTLLDILKVPSDGFLDSKYSDATGKLEHLSV